MDRLPKRWREADARRVLEAWEHSGLGLHAFARQQGFTVQRLAWWRKQLGGQQHRRRGGAARMSLVPAVVSPAANGATVRIRLRGEVTIECCDAPPDYVASLVRALWEST